MSEYMIRLFHNWKFWRILFSGAVSKYYLAYVTSPGSESLPTRRYYYYLQLQLKKLEGNQPIIRFHHPTSKAKQSKTKQKKDWGEINLLAQNPKPKP